MPFPSSGCRTCKIRRIKCDGAQPVCQKCMKSRRVCQSVGPRQSYSVVHIENVYASGQRKRPRGPRSNQNAGLTGNSKLVRQLAPGDLKTQAITYYIHRHLQAPDEAPGILKGISNDFLSKWATNPKVPMLDLSISSIALAVFSRTQNHPPAARRASHEYCQLLLLMRATMPLLDETNIDDFLVAIFFMGRYEDASYCSSHLDQKIPFLKSLQSFSHHDGALAVLREWKNNLSNHHPATEIIKHSRRGLIRSALLRTLPIPAWMCNGSLFGECGLDLEYDSIITSIANARHEVFALVQENSQKIDESADFMFRVKRLDLEAQTLDKALQDWTNHFPGEWSYRRYTSQDFKTSLETNLDLRVIFGYSKPAYGATWNHYFATRMLINSTRLRILNLVPPDEAFSFQSHRFECLDIIETMAANLVASLPVALERAKVTEHWKQPLIRPTVDITHKATDPGVAALSAWPLSLVSSIEHLGLLQKSRFRSELAYVGKILGSGIFQYAESGRWLIL